MKFGRSDGWLSFERAARQMIFKMTAMRRGDYPPICEMRARAPVTAGRLNRR